MRIWLYLLLFLAFAATAAAQHKDYVTTDSLARTKKYNGDLRLLVSQLTEGYIDDTHKARAIFAWVTDNIAYDYKAFNKKKHYKMPKCKKGEDCLKIVADWKEDYTNKVLRSGKSVCDGYAWLFKRMCDYAGLQTDFVGGYTKHSPDDVGRMGSLNHAWNGIILDGKYYYLDVTWASGTCSKNRKGKLDGFQKDFDDFYWLTPIEKFSIDHYPKDAESPGVANYPMQKYRDNPFIKKYTIPDITIFEPESGVIQARVGQVINISFTCAYNDIEDISISDNVYPLKTLTDKHTPANKTLDYSYEPVYSPFWKIGDVYTIQYTVTNKNLRYIEVYLGYSLLIKFKVKVIK